MSLTIEQFKTRLSTLSDNVESTSNEIHTLALDALEQGNVHGNINKMVLLVATLGTKGNAAKVMAWACHFGRFGTKKNEIDGKLQLVYQNKKLIDGSTFDSEIQQILASESPYHSFVKPKDESKKVVFDLEAELRKLLKQCASIKEGKKDATLIHDEYESLIKAMLPEGKAELTARA